MVCYKYSRKSFIILITALFGAVGVLYIVAIREYKKSSFSLSERDMVCIYFFYQNSFSNKLTYDCSTISDKLPFYEVTITKQYCKGNNYVVELSSNYTETENLFDNPCGYPEKLILENCSDTIIDGYYNGTVYSDLLNREKVAKDSLEYNYLHSFDRDQLQTRPYPFQVDSPAFIDYCLKNERLLSPVLKFILKHKGYIE